MADTNKPSKVEQAKAASNNLRGTIAETLADVEAPNFSEDDKQLLKFHGIYQGADRDKGKKDKTYEFMIRVAVPGGRCTAEQYLALDDLASEFANDTLRLTTRQAFQFHAIAKDGLWETMNGINKALMSSLAACGDVPRNVMAAPAPYADDIHRGVQAMARDIAKAMLPATGAYHEIWVDGEKAVTADHGAPPEEETFFGPTYLPRKFKIGVAIDFDNSIDLYAYDAGLVAVTDNGSIVGYNVLAGGGLGMTHGKPDTIARMASPVGFVAPEHGVDVIREIIAIHRDFGNRSNRRAARLKYLLEEWGVEKFIATLKERSGFTIEEPRPTQRPRQLDHLGRHDQGDGKQFLGVWVANGRVKTDPDTGVDTRGAFRQIAEELSPTVILTPMQSIIFGDLTPDQADRAEAILAEHNVETLESLTNARRYSMACPSLPTCGLGIAEAERAQPEITTSLEQLLDGFGLADVELTVRMTGCPNGCARPYNADIGLVGRKPGAYHVYVGGGLGGERLADLFEANVPTEKLGEVLTPLLRRFADERREGEGLSDYYRRAIATDRPERTLLTGREEPTAKVYGLEVLQ